MSGIDNGAAGRQKPDLQLSRRSLVAAGALLAAMGPFGARVVRANDADAFSDNNETTAAGWGDYCKTRLSNIECQCFLSGTRLLTPSGNVPIEGLGIGDLVATEGGNVRPIRWIGRITVDRYHKTSWHADAMPVRIAKDALGAGCPSRDLYVSRAHMMHLDGVLIPVGDLINGQTIAAVNVEGDQLVYYHVELETHDVVIAEGAPCESLLTTAEKLAAFDNADEYYALYGTPADMAPCAPMAAFNGGRSELRSRLRSAVAVVIDRRQPRDIVRDCLEARAFELSKAA